MVFGQAPRSNDVTLAGVYQGLPLFIKNSYNRQSNGFCISDVYLNDTRLPLNYQLSALKIAFKETDLFTPVSIRVIHADSLCEGEIVNPEAILFHSSYKFLTVSLTDTALYWTTEGEREIGTYVVEKLQDGIWVPEKEIPADAKFEFAAYIFHPFFEEGPNKYRVKYEFGTGRYLYSQEVEYEHYPDPVSFEPLTTNHKLYLSRSAFFEVFNQKSEMVLSGTGTEVNVGGLRPGDYVIYFDKKQPNAFRRDNRPPPRNR